MNTVPPHEMLYQYMREVGHCDVIIDRLAGFPFHDELDALDDKSAQKHALNDPIFKEAREKAPLLVRLGWQHVDLLEKCLSQAIHDATNLQIQTRAICAFIFSTDTCEEIAAHLSKLLNATIKDTGNIYFRYFDPRVTQHLPQMLTGHQLSSLLRPIQKWAYVNWNGQFETISAELESPGFSRMIFTQSQWQNLSRIPAANLAIAYLKLASHRLKQSDVASLHDHLLTAESLGLTSIEDCAIFAACSTKFTTAFLHHPDLKQTISFTVEADVPFASVLEQKLGADLGAPTLPTASSNKAST